MTVEESKRHVRECKPMPNPDINKSFFPHEQLFTHKNGIVHYLYPDYLYHFFRILRNEKKLYQQKKRRGTTLGMGMVSMN